MQSNQNRRDAQDKNYKSLIMKQNLESQINETKSKKLQLQTEMSNNDKDNNEKLYY